MSSRAVRRWLPNQHGAWAMLVVPFLAGMLLGDPTPWHALLLLAWLLGYLAVFHVQQWLRLRHNSRNPRAAARHTRPVRLFTTALVPCGVALVVHAPWLLLAAVCAAPFLAVNCWYAWRNRERALVNGLVAVVPACGMLPVALLLGGGAIADAWRPALACLLYFAGTVLYVKTMIRERGSTAYRWASGGYHAVALGVAAAVLGPWLAGFFAVCLGRALAVPALGRVRVGVVGAGEAVLSVLLLTALLLSFG
ncbi:YwiC-like family protein [Streptomyces sp. NPDC000987]|uniref:YwiC-like family protein n=1 Tax=Streptomyces sp. NPDC000987 TaxID=3154374 RepID=UPI00332ADFBF